MLQSNELKCFSNRDYQSPTYIGTLLCMFFEKSLSTKCHSIWGSRTVSVEVNGSVEFFKLNRLPQESSPFYETTVTNAIRWLQLTSPSTKSYLNIAVKDAKQVPCEPMYICARSNDWKGGASSFEITFKSGHIRFKDRMLVLRKAFFHIFLIIVVSSARLLPYIASLIVASITYEYSIKYMIMISIFSACVVCLTPLMLTKKNRHFAQHYIRYFFTRIHAEETREIIKKRIIVFQAIYFSSALICVGVVGSYILYSYFNIDRGARNVIIKCTIGMAASWLTFSFCRSFERFSRDWSWIVMCIGLIQLVNNHLNPFSREEVFVVILVVSFTVKVILSKIFMNNDWTTSKYIPYSKMKMISSSKYLMHSLRRVVKLRNKINQNSQLDLNSSDEIYPTESIPVYPTSLQESYIDASHTHETQRYAAPQNGESASASELSQEIIGDENGHNFPYKVAAEASPVATLSDYTTNVLSSHCKSMGLDVDVILDPIDDTTAAGAVHDVDSDGSVSDDSVILEDIDGDADDFFQRNDYAESGYTIEREDIQPTTTILGKLDRTFSYGEDIKTLGNISIDNNFFENVRLLSRNKTLAKTLTSALAFCIGNFESDIRYPSSSIINTTMVCDCISFTHAHRAVNYFGKLRLSPDYTHILSYIQRAMLRHLCLLGIIVEPLQPKDYRSKDIGLVTTIQGSSFILRLSTRCRYKSVQSSILQHIGGLILRELFRILLNTSYSRNLGQFQISSLEESIPIFPLKYADIVCFRVLRNTLDCGIGNDLEIMIRYTLSRDQTDLVRKHYAFADGDLAKIRHFLVSKHSDMSCDMCSQHTKGRLVDVSNMHNVFVGVVGAQFGLHESTSATQFSDATIDICTCNQNTALSNSRERKGIRTSRANIQSKEMLTYQVRLPILYWKERHDEIRGESGGINSKSTLEIMKLVASIVLAMEIYSDIFSDTTH